MIRRTTGGSGVIVAGIAALGLLGGHVLDYLLVAHDPGQRSALLHATGHGYAPTASAAALALGVLAVVWAAGRGYARGRGRAAPRFGAASLALRLCLLQAAGFVALEVGERLLAGLPLASLAGPLLPLGCLLQAGVAALGALVLVLVDRAAEAAGRSVGGGRARRRSVAASFPLPLDGRASRRLFCHRGLVRGPPLPPSVSA